MEISVPEQKETTDKEVLKMVQKLKSTFDKLLNKDQQPVIETALEQKDSKEEFGNEPLPPKEWYGTFDDPSEQEKCKEVALTIEEGLKIARQKVLKCEVLIPCGLTRRIARDILLMSESEPCGIRGCCLSLHLQEKSNILDLGKVQCDPNTVSTFEIHLTIQEDTRNWAVVKKMMFSMTGCFKNSVYKSSPKMMGLGYKLEKLKLYRTSS